MFFFRLYQKKNMPLNDTTLMLFLKPSHLFCVFANIALQLGSFSCAEAYMKQSIDPTTRGRSWGLQWTVWQDLFCMCGTVSFDLPCLFACLYGFYIFFSWNTCNIKMIWQNSRWISLRNSKNYITVIRKIVINKPGYPILVMLALFHWGHVPS